MGLNVINQIDIEKEFSLTSINRNLLKKYGINSNLTAFKETVRHSKPYKKIITGNSNNPTQIRQTNIYRYEDFTPSSTKDST